uniref:Nucleolar protein 6 n=1 Tax=Nothobranchius pienaari TaxID=704102 RepID=A0A1A8RC09_9TELE
MKKKRQTGVKEQAEMHPSDSFQDEEEGETEEAEPSVKAKRIRSEEEKEVVVYHPVKLSRNDLYRPPTAEELNQLKEAESLFHCSLLKMQMEELLKEVVLSEHRKQQIDSFIQTVTKLIQTVPKTPKVEVNDMSWLSGAVKVPFLLLPKTTKGKFCMAPPASVDLIGSYALGTCIKPHIRVDMAVTIPAEVLQPKDFLNQRPCPTHLDVWKNGLAFRIQVAYHREPQVLRERVTAEELLVVRDNEEAQALEMATIHKPLLTSMLHGLQQQHPCFGAVCRLAKRWLAAQLFSDEITEDAADLLVASLFLQPAPFTAPGSPQVGFLRFLHLLSSFDWRNNPLVVNLNNQLTAADYTEIKNDFMASRDSLPVMFLATPKDKKLSLWTRRAPSIQMLQRVMMVAAESLKVLECQLMDGSQMQDVRVVMRPPLEAYDVLIHLNPNQVPLLGQAVDPPAVTFNRGVVPNGAPQSGGPLPVIDYNPVTLYLMELREAFGDLALFFCDPYGGTVISVLWKPKTFVSAPFKTSQITARTVEVTGEEVKTIPNFGAILEDFRVLGKGLVKSVEAKTEKWAF